MTRYLPLLLLCGSAMAEELKIPTRGATLAATLALPDGPGPHPAVVLVHGSGKVTRSMMDGMARGFRDAGIAVLAYDKRGVGESTGEYSSVGVRNSVQMLDLLAQDALAAVHALQARKDIDPRRIGLAGASQAGWIIPLAASRSPSVKWMVILSGPAVSVGEEIKYSELAGEDPGSRKGLSDAEIEAEMKKWTGDPGYDPVATLEKLTAPSFWLQGEKDRSIPQPRTLATLHRIRREGKPITVFPIPNADHGLRDVTTRQVFPFWPPTYRWLLDRGVIARLPSASTPRPGNG
ncbi:MAG: alpha/beta fold hydrolase [Bryobacteraceae bacterium]|nr:alpha/beta fold hydrolase [Bryobacteraceae bacterium]